MECFPLTNFWVLKTGLKPEGDKSGEWVNVLDYQPTCTLDPWWSPKGSMLVHCSDRTRVFSSLNPFIFTVFSSSLFTGMHNIYSSTFYFLWGNLLIKYIYILKYWCYDLLPTVRTVLLFLVQCNQPLSTVVAVPLFNVYESLVSIDKISFVFPKTIQILSIKNFIVENEGAIFFYT